MIGWMRDMPEKHTFDRRNFIRIAGRTACAFALGGIAFRLTGTKKADAGSSSTLPRNAWRINPGKCTHCGNCSTACVRRPSAVKAVNDQKTCSFCVVCYGHISNHDIASEKIQAEGKSICPRNAVKRRNYSGGLDGYFIYSVDDKKCIGCAKCVKECNQLGSKSMFLVIRPDLCLGCNRCEIAARCPSGAVESVQMRSEYDSRNYIPEKENSARPKEERG